MKFSLIICTYQRPQAMSTLLASILNQTVYPDEIIVVDGSLDNVTEMVLLEKKHQNISYHLVSKEDRGLTKQRNFGISKVAKDSEVVCFLDDDTILEKDYFKNLITLFSCNPTISGVGGVATNENRWEKKIPKKKYANDIYYEFDNYVIKRGSRHILRNKLGLGSNELPGVMPEFSNGTSYGYPLNGEFYKVDLLIGMSMAFRKQVTDSIKFSTYFEGYGLYEDADYSIRALAFGENVLATNVQLEHHHHPDGRPNNYKYGKMVVRNGWYVWRVKYSNPSFKARFKWNAIVLLLISIRFTNVFNTNNRIEAFTETIGRLVGFISLIFLKPKHKL